MSDLKVTPAIKIEYLPYKDHKTLRTAPNFAQKLDKLWVELDKSYVVTLIDSKSLDYVLVLYLESQGPEFKDKDLRKIQTLLKAFTEGLKEERAVEAKIVVPQVIDAIPVTVVKKRGRPRKQ